MSNGVSSEKRKVVLRAFWGEFVAVNFQIDPHWLEKIVPKGLEVDLHNGVAYLSLVCATCRDIRLWGLPLPISRGYRNVFLRYYVRRPDENRDERGSVMIKGLVSNSLARWTVSRAIHTNVEVASIKCHNSGFDGKQGADTIPEANYSWKLKSAVGKLKIKARHRINSLGPETKVGFILNRSHHFVDQNGQTMSYPMEVSSSNVWDAGHATFSCDSEIIFGRDLGKALSRRPISVFLAEKNTTCYFAPQSVG